MLLRDLQVVNGKLFPVVLFQGIMKLVWFQEMVTVVVAEQ